jgi:hypothetical protein
MIVFPYKCEINFISLNISFFNKKEAPFNKKAIL